MLESRCQIVVKDHPPHSISVFWMLPEDTCMARDSIDLLQDASMCMGIKQKGSLSQQVAIQLLSTTLPDCQDHSCIESACRQVLTISYSYDVDAGVMCVAPA